MSEDDANVEGSALEDAPINSGGGGNGNLDMDALRQLSMKESGELFGSEGEQPESEGDQDENPSDDEEQSSDEDFEDDEEGADGGSEEEEGDEEEEDEDVDDDDEEDDEDYEEDDEEEEDEGTEKITARSKDGKKEYSVPKDALWPVKINGKQEYLSHEKVLQLASGATHLDREFTELGKNKKQLAEAESKLEARSKKINDNASLLLDLAQNGDPEDFLVLYGQLSGQDPEVVWNKMIENTLKYAEKFSQMTDQELRLYNENRRYKFNQKIATRQQKLREAETSQSETATRIEKKLADRGYTVEQYGQATEDFVEKWKAGEIDVKDPGPEDVLDHLDSMVHESKINDAISKVNPSLHTDLEFVGKLSRAVAKAEGLTGEQMTLKEVQQLVRSAVGDMKTKASERMSRKVKRAKRSGKTNSKSVSSRKKNDVGPLTLDDHHTRLREMYNG